MEPEETGEDSHAELSAKLVLVVEDDMETRYLLRDLLSEELGCRVVSACDAEAALPKLLALRPDLVIMDISLRGMSGLQLYDAMQRVKLIGATPVIFLTAGNYDNELKQRGIGVFLHKPFGIEYLLSLVKALLAGA